MFEVYLNNFGYCLQQMFSTREEAIEAGRNTGFQFTVWPVTDN